MYACYAYNAAASQTNILNDLKAIITGETNKANLSAACDQANTEILTTYTTSAWTLHDDAAATNQKVFKLLCQDGINYAYFGLDLNTANALKYGIAETWNNTTHTGTNFAYLSATSSIVSGNDFGTYFAPSTNSGFIYILIDPYSLFLGCRNANGSSSFYGVTQITRMGPAIINTALPQFCFLGAPALGNYNAAFPRIKSLNAAGFTTGSQAYRQVGAYTFSNFATPSSTYSIISTKQARDYNDNLVYQAMKLSSQFVTVSDTSNSYPAMIEGFILGDAVCWASGAMFDECAMFGKTYIRLGALGLNNGGSYAWWPKG